MLFVLLYRYDVLIETFLSLTRIKILIGLFRNIINTYKILKKKWKKRQNQQKLFVKIYKRLELGTKGIIADINWLH